MNDGVELRGGQLTEPLIFLETDPQPAVHLVGFLSQKLGSKLQIYDSAGKLLRERRYEPVLPLDGAVGGLRGPS